MASPEASPLSYADEESEEEERATSPPLPRRARRKRKIVYKESEEESDGEESVAKANDDDGGSASEARKPTRKPRKRGRPTPKVKTEKADTIFGTKEERTCPHCQKVFSKLHNLRYHIERYVCRKDQMPVRQVVEEESEEGEEEVNEEVMPTRTSPRRKRMPPLRLQEESANADDNVSTESEGEDEDEEYDVPKRNKKTKKKNDLTCPLCNKLFSMKNGLDYHLEHKVCLRKKPAPKPAAPKEDGPKKKFKRPPASKASGRKYNRVRGPLEERTCPNCKRVFTSVLGRDYHVVNKVCQKKPSLSKGLPFDTLEPGAEFVTKYGVVRVVSDSRAVPTAKLTKENEKKLKTWKAAKLRLDVKRRDGHSKVAVHSLARRKRLNSICQYTQWADTELPKQIWNAYYGSTNLDDPEEGRGHWNFPFVVPEFPPGPHPMEPEESHADRIVECVLIPDRRKLYDCMTIGDPDSGEEEFVQSEREIPEMPEQGASIPMKLYIERRQLNQDYNENGSRFQCVDCGRAFVSIVGCKYHVTAKACHNKMGRKGEKHETPAEIVAGLDRRAEILMEAQEQLLEEDKKGNGPFLNAWGEPHHGDSRVQATSSDDEMDVEKTQREREIRAAKSLITQPRNRNEHGQFKKPQRKWLPKKKRPMAYYPQVWRSLGFKVVPKAPRAAPVSFFKRKRKGDFVHPNAQLTQKIHDGNDLQNTFKSLQDELMKLHSEQLGAYYPSVWRVLRFRKPAIKNYTFIRRSEEGSEAEEEEMPEIGRKRSKSPEPFVPQPPPFAYAPPVIIDISVLAGEIDMGRYPSIKRNTPNMDGDGDGDGEGEGNDAAPAGDKHADFCYMCKDSRGLLYLCDFCTNVNHLECIRTRFIIKDPEPHDDFMCNKCIQCVLQRRRRAEKRRMRRSLGENAVEEKKTFRGPYGKFLAEPEEGAAAATVQEPEQPKDEFDMLASQGQHVEEILELIRDSQGRLQQLVETSKINEFRRSLFEE